MSVIDALDTFVEHYRQSHPTLLSDYDPEWRSACEVGQPIRALGEAGDKIVWRPSRRNSLAQDFSGLENALETEIHADIKDYYGRYWSSNLAAEAPDGHISMLFLWNQDDVERLIENLIGHSMTCKQNKAPFSVFFACTEDDSELFLSINNATGEVQLEDPGHPPIRVVANSLEDFLPYLVPSPSAG